MRGLLLVMLSVLVLAVGDEVMEVDPAQDADVASRIARTGEWWRLEDMNGPFINKPPLMMHAQALCMRALGPTSAAARWPALFFAVMTVAGVGLVGWQLGGRGLALRAAGLLSGSVALHHMVADPKVDLALSAQVTWAIAAFIAARRQPRYLLAGWCFTALAVLAKGPIGLAMVVFALVARPPRWHMLHLVGVALFVVLLVPFYTARPEAAGYLLWNQGLGRLFASAEFHDTTTPLYVLHTAAWALLPMGPLAGLVLFRRSAFPEARWWLLLTCGVVAVARFKLPQYVYWVAPPAALLGAQALEQLKARWPAVVLAAGSAALGCGVLVFCFPSSGLATVAWAFVLVTPIVVALKAPCDLAWAASLAGFLVLFQWWIHPSLLEFQPSRELGARVQQLEPGRTVLPLLATEPTFSLTYYAQRELKPVSVEDAPAGLLITTDDGLRALRERGRTSQVVLSLPSYHVSIPRLPFLLAKSRASNVTTLHLVRATP